MGFKSLALLMLEPPVLLARLACSCARRAWISARERVAVGGGANMVVAVRLDYIAGRKQGITIKIDAINPVKNCKSARMGGSVESAHDKRSIMLLMGPELHVMLSGLLLTFFVFLRGFRTAESGKGMGCDRGAQRRVGLGLFVVCF